MYLQKLPNEILLAIAYSLDSEADINSLSCINHQFHTLLTPFLYGYDVTHSDGSALRWAAQTSQLSTARRALDAGAQVRPFEVFSLLLEHIAATSAPGSGDLNVCNTLTTKEVHQMTPLFYASGSGHADIVRIILEKDIDPNMADCPGRTPLYVASLQGQTAVVEALLKHPRIDINKADQLESSLFL